MQKKPQTQFVHRIGLGEGQTLSDEASESLPQSVVPSLDMCRQASLFAHCRMLLRRNDQLVGFPKVTVAMGTTIGGGNVLPEFSTSGGASVANDISHDLSGGATQSDPNPAFIGTL